VNNDNLDAIRAETITITGHGGDEIEAYRATPLAEQSRGGVVWIHHMPGYDRETKEFVRRLAVGGYHAVAPNLYSREAPGAAAARAALELTEESALALADAIRKAIAHAPVGLASRDQ
jgi:carboxymethylenebutenolidase